MVSLFISDTNQNIEQSNMGAHTTCDICHMRSRNFSNKGYPVKFTELHKSTFGVELDKGIQCTNCFRIITRAVRNADLSREMDDVNRIRLLHGKRRLKNKTHETSPPTASNIENPNLAFQQNPHDPDFSFCFQDKRLLAELLLRQPCPHCNSSNCLEVINGRDIGVTFGVTIQCTNQMCRHKFSWYSSNRVPGSKEFEANQRVTAAGHLANMSYQEMQRFLSLASVRPIGKTKFATTGTKEIWPTVTSCTEESLSEAREEYVNNVLDDFLDTIQEHFGSDEELGYELLTDIYETTGDAWYIQGATDGRYSSRGWNAMECSTCMFELQYTRHILFACHILKARTYERDLKETQVRDASCNLEGIAIAEIVDEMKTSNVHGLPFGLRSYTHDHDGKTAKIIRSKLIEAEDVQDNILYPVEQLDNGHGKKNFQRRVTEQCPSHGARAGRRWSFAQRTFVDDADGWRTYFRNCMEHDIGNHDGCTEKCKGGQRLHLDNEKHKVIYEKLKKLYYEIADMGSKYVHSNHSNICESLHRSMLRACEKTLDFSQTYAARINSEVMRHNHGDLSALAVLDQLGIPVDRGTELYFNMIQRQHDQMKDHKNDPDSRLNKAITKKKVRGIHQKETEQALKHNDGFYPASSEQKRKRLDENDEEKEIEKKKRKIVDNGYCDCSGKCDSKRCKCKKAIPPRKCSENCHKTKRKTSNVTCENV